jgi:hypothetical protein
VVPVGDRSVSVTVHGDAELVGLGTARPVTEESFLADSCTTFDGRAQADVRQQEGGSASGRVMAD